MYAARVQNKDLTFVVSGMLWQRSLVMKDLETETLWSHLLGQAMQGPLKGEQLEVLPSAMTDWKSWKAEHPETTVLNLSRTSREYRREFYSDPARFLVGIVHEGKARAWSFDLLQEHPVVNDMLSDLPVVVVFDNDSLTANLYDRKLGDRTLIFQWTDGKWVDRQTQSHWNPLTGKAIQGPLAGSQLEPLPEVVSYTRAWRNFHPDSTYWQPEE